MKYNFIAQTSWEKLNSGPSDQKIHVVDIKCLTVDNIGLLRK